MNKSEVDEAIMEAEAALPQDALACLAALSTDERTKITDQAIRCAKNVFENTLHECGDRAMARSMAQQAYTNHVLAELEARVPPSTPASECDN